ncbi:MAG: zf-HC2 domain-containing protein [Elusimicrobia bacterium]|nr:zf-HC2 domain-containing protein [Elusimicrobiota bacterium]
MNCKTAKSKISDYVDGILETDERILFENHISSCPRCAEDLKKMKKLKDIMGLIQAPALSEDFDRKLHYKLIEAKYRNQGFALERIFDFFRPVSVRVVSISAVAAVVVALIVFSGRRNEVIFVNGPGDFAGYKTASFARVLNVNREGILKLNFVSGKKIKNIELKIELPDGIALADGSRNVEWRGNLRKGNNIVLLKVRGVKVGQWDVRANLRKNSVEKTVERKIFVKPDEI